MSIDIRGLDVALQQDAYGHLHDRLDAGLLIAVHLAHADIVLAVASSCQYAHLEFWEGNLGIWKRRRSRV